MLAFIVEGYVPQQDDGSDQHLVTIGLFDDYELARQAVEKAEKLGYDEVVAKSFEINKAHFVKR